MLAHIQEIDLRFLLFVIDSVRQLLSVLYLDQFILYITSYVLFSRWEQNLGGTVPAHPENDPDTAQRSVDKDPP